MERISLRVTGSKPAFFDNDSTELTVPCAACAARRTAEAYLLTRRIYPTIADEPHGQQSGIGPTSRRQRARVACSVAHKEFHPPGHEETAYAKNRRGRFRGIDGKVSYGNRRMTGAYSRRRAEVAVPGAADKETRQMMADIL